MSDARKIQEGAEWTPDDYGTDSDYRATPSDPPERSRPLSGIERTIALHRAACRDDLEGVHSASQRTPPVAYQRTERDGLVADDRPLVYFVDGRYIEVPDSATQSTQVGMPMSGRMYRYVSGPSPETPWSAALMRLRAHCRKEHRRRYHSVEKHWNGSLCHQMVIYVVIRGWSVQNAAAILDYDNPEPILRDAFAFMEDQIDDFRRKQEQRALESEGHALTCACGHSWSRHDNPATMFACASCECGRYRAESKAA